MKRISILLLAVATLAVTTIGCNSTGSGGSGDPKAVLMAFSEKLSKKDFDGAAQLATKESKSFIDLMKMGMEMAEKFGKMGNQKPEEENNFKDVEIGDAKINGDVAMVPFTVKGKTTFDFPLKKEDGAWKVDMTLATMAKMGMDADKEGSKMNSEDINELKNLNMDSIKGMADSIMKVMTPEKLEQMKKMGEDFEKKMKETSQ